MKKTTIALAALLATVYVSGAPTFAEEQGAKPAQEGKLVWYGVKDGFAKAKEENKSIITDFFTDWCGWCKKMDRDTYDNAAVVKELVPNFIMVKADAEDKSAGQKLATENGINGYPTFIIFDAQGARKEQVVGYKKPDEFLKIIKAYEAKSGK
jgi:thiol:disulfide interchange protein